MKKIKLITTILISLPLLTGCWDRVEINDLAFVIASGMDKKTVDVYTVSAQVALPSAMGGAGSSGGGGGTSGGPYYVDSGTGRNIRESSDNLQNRLSRSLYYAHTRVAVMGEKLAKGGITEALNIFLTQPQTRLSTFLLISKGSAQDILNRKTKLEQLPGEAMREMAKNSIGMTIKDVVEDMNREGKEAVVPYVTINKGKSGFNLSQFAIFHKDQLAFVTNSRESLAVLWLRNKMTRKSLTFRVKGKDEVSVQVIESFLKPKLKMVNGKPFFTLKVDISATLLENEGNLNINNPRIYSSVIQDFQEEVKSEIKSLLDKSHSKGIDVAGLGWYVYRNHNNIWDSELKKDWEKTLPDLDVKVSVDSEILRMTNSGRYNDEL